MANAQRDALFAALDDDDERRLRIDWSRRQLPEALDRSGGIDVSGSKEDDAYDGRAPSHRGASEVRVVSHDHSLLTIREFENPGIGDSREPPLDRRGDVDTE